VHFWAVGHHGIRFSGFVITHLLRTDIRNVSAILSWLLQFPTMFASRAISHCDLLWGISPSPPLPYILWWVDKGACRMGLTLIELGKPTRETFVVKYC
jgi:hypothetical protein